MFVNLFQFVMKIFFFPEIAIREALEIFFLGISPKSVTKIAINKQSEDNPSRRVILADKESEVFI